MSWGSQAPDDLTNIVALSARRWHGLAVRSDGTVKAWNDYGSNEPPVIPGLRSVAMVAAGADHSLGLKSDGTVAGWGDNFYNQINVPAGLGEVVAIAAGDNHSLALKADGTVIGWGDNHWGQSTVPADLANVVAIAAGGNLSVALRTDGSVVTWGQIGQTLPWFPTMIAIGAGDGFSLGLMGDQAPHFSVHPPRLVVQANDEVILGAKVVGLRPMTYQWRLNGNDIPGATDDVYRLHGAQLVDAGIYTLLASNALGSAHSREADLQILPKTNHPPILVVQADRTINARSRMVVTNTAIDPDGAADHLTYRLIEAPKGASIDSQGVIAWSPALEDVPSRNVFTTVVADDGLPSLETTNSFTVVVLDWAQTGPVSILAGPIFNPATGHRYFLLDAASWTDCEATAVAMGGHLVTINDQEEYIWIGSTFVKANGTYRSIWTGLIDPDPSITQAYGLNVWVNHFRWASGQPITFFAWDGSSSVPSTGLLRVKMAASWSEEVDSTALNGVVEVPAALQIISQPHSLSVGIGRDATLTVVADGTDLLSYQWQFQGTNLPGATTSALNLVKVAPTQSGPYQVVVSNLQGVVISDKAVVSVTGLVGWGISFGDVLNAPVGATNVVAIAASGRHALALRDDGAVVGWGNDQHGESDIPAGLGPSVAIAAGLSFSLALATNGVVTAWGDNSFGQTNVPSDLTNVVGIAAGLNHCLAVKADGTVAAWGSYAAPPAGLTNVVSVAAGGIYDLALRADGTVVTWGSDVWDSFTKILTNVVAISAGPSHSLALLVDGTVVAWGDNMFGQTNVPPLLSNVVAISAGGVHSMALTAAGEVVEWGELIGDVARPPDLPNVVAIAGGDTFSLALLQDGAPHLTVQPQDQVVTLGDNSTFAAKVVGNQAMRYQWKFNGEDIAGATHDTYFIASAQLTNGGLYSLSVSNSVGILDSRQAKLVVMDQATNPVVVLQPLGLFAEQFRLRVNGTIGLKYVLEASSEPPNWISLQTSSPPIMPFELMDNAAGAYSNRVYRVRLEK